MGIPKTKIIQMEKDIKEINRDNTLQMDDVDKCCNSLTDSLTRVEKYTVKMKHSQRKTRLHWLNSEILLRMIKRDLALKAALSSGFSTDLLTYKGLSNKVTMALRKAKASYFSQLTEEAKGNSASLWKHLNKLTVRLGLKGKTMDREI